MDALVTTGVSSGGTDRDGVQVLQQSVEAHEVLDAGLIKLAEAGKPEQ